MSPITAPPSFGYADYQKVQNWDGPILLDVTTPGTNAPFTSSVMDVRRYSHISGTMQCLAGACLVFIAWYNDAAATQQLGRMQFSMDANIPNAAQQRISNQGPFCQVTVSNFGGNPYTYAARLIATNRDDPLQQVPVNSFLMLQRTATTGTGTTDHIWPGDYYSGPARVAVALGGNNWIITQEILGSGGSYIGADSIQYQTATNGSDWNILVPQGGWRLAIANFTGAANGYNISVIHSTTGSM